MGISAIRTFIAGVTRARALRACRLRKPLRSNAARYCITEVWLANPKWLWISRVLGVTPFSRCSRWMKSRTRLCRSVSMLNNDNESRRWQVQVNILPISRGPEQDRRLLRQLWPTRASGSDFRSRPVHPSQAATAAPDQPETGTKDKTSRARNISLLLRSLFEDAFVNVVCDLVAQIFF